MRWYGCTWYLRRVRHAGEPRRDAWSLASPHRLVPTCRAGGLPRGHQEGRTSPASNRVGPRSRRCPPPWGQRRFVVADYLLVVHVGGARVSSWRWGTIGRVRRADRRLARPYRDRLVRCGRLEFGRWLTSRGTKAIRRRSLFWRGSPQRNCRHLRRHSTCRVASALVDEHRWLEGVADACRRWRSRPRQYRQFIWSSCFAVVV